MNKKEKAIKIAKESMYENDAFSKWLGIQILDLNEGFAKLSMTIRAEMTNGFGIAHGGITYSLADSTLAFASNSYGRHCLSVETSVAHLSPVMAGDIITSISKEESINHKIAIYSVDLFNQKNEKVAIFRGTVYRSSKEWNI